MSQQEDTRVKDTPEQHERESLGLAGRLAQSFIHSPLSPLLFGAMLAMGLLGLIFTPRQEDPQISVPMVDIFVSYPGASAEQVASLAIDPLERLMSEIPAVKHVYSASRHGQGMVTVQFEVGETMGPSLVKVNDKLDSNLDRIPPGVSMPLVKPKGIDDVPVVTITLWSEAIDDGMLRTLGLDVLQSLKQIPNTGHGFVVGGRSEQVRVEVMPERLSGYGISLDQVANTIRTANSELQAGSVESGGQHFTVTTGSFLRSAEDIARLVVATHNGTPIYVRDVANVFQAPEDADQLVQFYTGAAYPNGADANGVPSVTIAIGKKEGTNGVTVANAIIDKVHELQGRLIPDNVHIDVTRNYGKTANDKVNDLIFKLFVATFIVVVLIWKALGARPAVVVAFVIPVVILITVFSAWVLGLTIDRVSLFALIFSIGILVDDAIVVVENIYRRWLMKGEMDTETAIDAVREVGNPTILATFTVIAALLPMGFVSGMMGPYMAPIPTLGSVAMIFSLVAAFIFTPWLAMRIRPSMAQLSAAEEREHRQSERLERLFRGVLTPIIENPRTGRRVLIGIFIAFFVSVSLFYFKVVTVKMLPLDNKPEFSVVIDLPEGSALPVTANLADSMARIVSEIEEVTAIQSYVGTAQPFDFNGMVRHYYLRQDPWQGELHVQLLDKGERDRSSHEIAVEVRGLLTPLAREQGATITVVEMPPGPPVLQALVAEIYGPDAETRRAVAEKMTAIFDEVEIIEDVDNYLQGAHYVWRFTVDTEKAVRRGISVDTINRNLAMAMGGYQLGDVKQGTVLDPTYVVIQVPLATRAQITRLGDLPIVAGDGTTIPLSELGRFEQVPEDPIIYHKDLRPVEYVVGEAVGRLGAPIYGMFEVEERLADYVTPDGVTLSGHMLGAPADTGQSAFEWTGEWTVTYETFRDMGAAFAVALILIYILVVWEFGNFMVPAVIMAPIPLTLIGIIPGHMLLGAEFTATSMIGFIALAGIIVRNSILLVDFSMHAVRDGADVRDAVVMSCKARTRPILITAFALVGGSSVILFDPIFQGMAISLMFGVLVSTLLTLVVIPLGCISARAAFCPAGANGEGCANGSCSVPKAEVEKSTPVSAHIKAFAANAGPVAKAVIVDFARDSQATLRAARDGIRWGWHKLMGDGPAMEKSQSATEKASPAGTRAEPAEQVRPATSPEATAEPTPEPTAPDVAAERAEEGEPATGADAQDTSAMELPNSAQPEVSEQQAEKVIAGHEAPQPEATPGRDEQPTEAEPVVTPAEMATDTASVVVPVDSGQEASVEPEPAIRTAEPKKAPAKKGATKKKVAKKAAPKKAMPKKAPTKKAATKKAAPKKSSVKKGPVAKTVKKSTTTKQKTVVKKKMSLKKDARIELPEATKPKVSVAPKAAKKGTKRRGIRLKPTLNTEPGQNDE